jgi:hypothetical protein
MNECIEISVLGQTDGAIWKRGLDMKTLERKITREQAQLLFDVQDDSALQYYLRLVPVDELGYETAKGGAFQTDDEALQWIARAGRDVWKDIEEHERV